MSQDTIPNDRKQPRTLPRKLADNGSVPMVDGKRLRSCLTNRIHSGSDLIGGALLVSSEDDVDGELIDSWDDEDRSNSRC